ncbi:MAG: RNA polymerase sigma factor [Flavobacteriales bacterium]
MFRKKPKNDGSSLSDDELVVELQRAMDAELFGVLYDRYSARVYQKCIGLTRDRDVAKDLTHDIFMKAFLGLPKFDHRSKFGTWLYTISHNYCLDHLRRTHRARTNDIDEERLPGEHPDDAFEAQLLGLRADRLQHVLDNLDPADRALLLMKYQDELTVKEIQDTLVLTESAAKMRMLRARERALAKYHELYREDA